MKTTGGLDACVLFEAEFEKKVKKQVKEIISVTFN